MTLAYPQAETEQEPEYRCAHCRRLLFDTELDRQACFLCEERAAKQLNELPSLYGQLAEALPPGAANDRGGKVTTSRAAPLPLALTPLNLRAPGGIASGLQAIEDDWRGALGWGIPARTDGVRVFASWRTNPSLAIPRQVKFLTANLLWACTSYEEIAYDLDVISGLFWQAKNAITGTRPRLIYVQCRTLYDDRTECGERLAVDINRASTLCPACGIRWGREEWVALYEATRGTAA